MARKRLEWKRLGFKSNAEKKKYFRAERKKLFPHTKAVAALCRALYWPQPEQENQEYECPYCGAYDLTEHSRDCEVWFIPDERQHLERMIDALMESNRSKWKAT